MSPELKNKANAMVGWGVASVFFGWTIIVPVVGIIYYGVVTTAAKAEKLATPTRSAVGFWLCALFGVAQTWAAWIRPMMPR